jgi:hypothetical protein
MLKCTDIETGRPCVTCGCSPRRNPEIGRARQLAIPRLIDVLWGRLAVSLSSSSYRWPFRYQPFIHLCCEAKPRGASDGFASHGAGRQLLCLCQGLRCPGSLIVTIEIIRRRFCHFILVTLARTSLQRESG